MHSADVSHGTVSSLGRGMLTSTHKDSFGRALMAILSKAGPERDRLQQGLQLENARPAGGVQVEIGKPCTTWLSSAARGMLVVSAAQLSSFSSCHIYSWARLWLRRWRGCPDSQPAEPLTICQPGEGCAARLCGTMQA